MYVATSKERPTCAQLSSYTSYAVCACNFDAVHLTCWHGRYGPS